MRRGRRAGRKPGFGEGDVGARATQPPGLRGPPPQTFRGAHPPTSSAARGQPRAETSDQVSADPVRIAGQMGDGRPSGEWLGDRPRVDEPRQVGQRRTQRPHLLVRAVAEQPPELGRLAHRQDERGEAGKVEEDLWLTVCRRDPRGCRLPLALPPRDGKAPTRCSSPQARRVSAP